MYCLWNGEYGEHEIVNFSENHLRYMEEQHNKWIGHTVGDFICLKVEYDWGKRDQRWTIQCKRCGRIMYQYHVADWRRGKGRSLLCQCRKEEIQAEEQLKQQIRKERMEEQNRIREAKKIEKSKKEHTQSKYASDEWIGKRNGHLTVIGRNGKFFVAKCDCGNEVIVKPTFMFTYKNRKDCGMQDCPYSTPLERKSRERREKGFAFEEEIEKILKNKGYNATKTQNQADYGVDVIIQNDDGTKIAVQCKMQDSPAGVSAVQEAYAGGRFYDCTKFAVICDKGFSNPAIIMAKKLGVYLCDNKNEFNMPKDIDTYAKELLPVFYNNEKNQKLYEINGEKKTKADWCAIYGKPQYQVDKLLKQGCTFETALKTAEYSYPAYQKYTVRGVTGNLTEVCEFFEVLTPTVSYRMKHMGMTLEDAIFTPTHKIS